MKKQVLAILGAVFLTFASTQAQGSLITNGSFELGDYNNNDADNRPDIMLITPGMDNITGWNVTGALGVHWNSHPLGVTTDGTHAVDLQGENPPGLLSSFWTEFATTEGASYVLSFDAFTGNSINTATVSVGSLIDQSFTGGGPGCPLTGTADTLFSHYQYAFTAVSTTSRLTFQVSSTDGFGPVIDNVSVATINDSDSDGVIDQWDQCPDTPADSCTNRHGCICNEFYTEEQMNQMVSNILTWGDTNNDGKIGLAEAIRALRITSGVTQP